MQETSPNGVKIRSACEQDLPLILAFVKDLAENERLNHLVTTRRHYNTRRDLPCQHLHRCPEGRSPPRNAAPGKILGFCRCRLARRHFHFLNQRATD